MTSRQKLCVITGANAGIGKAAATQIATKGLKVILACRNLEGGEAALKDIQLQSGSNDVHLLQLDMSLQSSIRQFVKALKVHGDTVDILIHNAAKFDISQKQAVLTDEGIESIWSTNHIGPVYLTSLLLDQLNKSEDARVITVASKGLVLHPGLKIDLDDPEFKDKEFSVSKAYYHSKLAQVMYTYWLAEKMQSKLTANCIRVTNVKIDLSRYPNVSSFNKFLYSIKSRFSISPEAMAETYTYLATNKEAKGKTSLYWDENKRTVSSSKYSKDLEAQEKLMELTKSYLSDQIAMVT